jgi:hypothetical protein
VWLAGVHGARFAALLTRGHVDTVYLPVSKNSLGFLRDALFLGPAAARHIPLIVHFHGAGYDDFVRSAPAPVRALVRLLLQRATRAIVPGHTMKPMLRGLIADERIAVVPNGVADPLGGHGYIVVLCTFCFSAICFQAKVTSSSSTQCRRCWGRASMSP